MKKKTLPILMLIAGLSTAALAACGHEHKWEWKNSTDGETHWQECSCGEKLEGSEGKHEDVKNNSTNADGPDGKCDACGVHVHNYVWKSDALNHWQECEEGDKINEGVHEDVKNNETKVPGADGKCDDCARVATVVFNMKGHGLNQAPKNLYIDLGEKANEPTIEDDDCWKFKGWYTDENCSDGNEFDFDTAIDEVTTIYAKWVEDTTPGASKKYAFPLSLGLESLQSVENGKTIIFKLTADEEGRYTAALGEGLTSQNSTYTTTLTGKTVYGKDQDANEITFDMDEDETVYVMFTYQGENGDDLVASPLIRKTTDEPLPKDYFLSGDYSGGSMTLTLDRDTKMLTYFDIEYPFEYIAGKFDRVYFYMSDPAKPGKLAQIQLEHNSDGTYTLVSSSGTDKVKMTYSVPQTPVELSEIVGYYEPEGTAAYSGIGSGLTKLYIYASEDGETTEVLYLLNGYYSRGTAYYAKNKLSFGAGYELTLNLADDDSVTSISIDGKVYLRKSTLDVAPPDKIDAVANSEYVGNTYMIRTNSYGSDYFGKGYDTITVLDYATDTGVYTVAVSKMNGVAIYKLTISSDKETISLLDEEGNALESLSLLEYVYNDFPAATEDPTQITIAADKFQNGSIGTVYLYEIDEDTEGWYSITNIPEGVEIYYGLTQLSEDAKYDGHPVGDDAVNLTAGTIVCIFVDEVKAVSFTLATAEAAKGLSSDNPKELEDNIATITGNVPGSTYYFSFTAPAADKYVLHVFYDNGEDPSDSFYLTYTVNGGEEYSFDDNDAAPYITTITATAAGQVFNINVTTDTYVYKESITVAILDSYSKNAIDVVWTGEPVDNQLDRTATVTPGNNYHIDTRKTQVTASADAAFTVKLEGGATLEAIKYYNSDKFTARIPAGTEYFTIVSATEGLNVTLSQSIMHGNAGWPFELSEEAGWTLSVIAHRPVCFTLPAGAYIFTGDSENTPVLTKENDINFFGFAGQTFTVEEGDLLSCTYEDGNMTLTFEKLEEMLTAAQAGTYSGTVGEIQIELELGIYGNVTYSVKNGSSSMSEDAKLSAGDDGSYSFTYLDMSLNSHTITFAFVDGNLSLTDSSINEGVAISLSKKEVGGPVTYSGQISNEYNSTDVLLTITGNKVTYSRDFGEGNFQEILTDTTFTEEGGMLKYVDMWGTYTITISEDGNTVTFVDGEMGYSGTLTKQS